MTHIFSSTALQPFNPTSMGMEGPSLAAMLVPGIIGLAFGIFLIAALWKVYSKAGEPGWAAIIPIYREIVLLKIAGRPIWWFLLLLIPFVNAIIGIILCIDLARKFGKGTGFGIGLAFVSFICLPILGFGSAQYNAAA